ncbi:MAG: alanine racemase [Thermomicrobiales bacterium]|nr:alanine racemase [Thermomicrobiales bacterium]
MGEPDRPPGRAWSGRATRAEIDLDALGGNVRALRSLLPPGASLMAVVKANAYGHGATVVAREALVAGAERLAVATIGEAAVLRRAGIDAPILILGAIDPAEAPMAVRLRIELAIATEALLDAVADAARGTSPAGPVRLHVKVETGLHRYGAEPDLALALARRIARDPRLELAGAFTHFACADEADDGFTREQDAAFSAWLGRLRGESIAFAAHHRANSAATIGGWAGESGIARCGIAMYGIAPSPAAPLPSGVRPVMSLRSRVARVFDLRPGDTVGYGRTYRCEAAERAALVPVGYADGYARALSGTGHMALGGCRAPLLGRISMDQCVVRVPDGVDAESGAEVVVLGADPAGIAPSIEGVAEAAGTIGYEIASRIAARVPRVYVRGGEIVAVEDALSDLGGF